jgi:LmbE family N-acetylglucosaminyl deacetylase
MDNTRLRFLVAVAHPHDFTHCAGTLGVHTALGDSVTIVVATSGALTHNEKLGDEMKKPPEERDPAIVNAATDEYAAQKAEELRKAAALFGVTDIRILDGPQPFAADENPHIIEQMSEIIREVRPHVLINQSPYLQSGSSHGLLSGYVGDDHIQTAFAIQRAQYFAHTPRADSKHQTHKIAATFYPGVYFSRDQWDLAVDISDWFDKRVEAEKLYKSQGHWDAWADKRMEVTLGNQGWYSGTLYAEGFVRAHTELVPKITLSPFTLRAAVESEKEHMERLIGSPKPD